MISRSKKRYSKKNTDHHGVGSRGISISDEIYRKILDKRDRTSAVKKPSKRNDISYAKGGAIRLSGRASILYSNIVDHQEALKMCRNSLHLHCGPQRGAGQRVRRGKLWGVL